jgi:hypothetical protein
MVVRVGTKNQIHNGEEAKEKWEIDRERERDSPFVCNTTRESEEEETRQE